MYAAESEKDNDEIIVTIKTILIDCMVAVRW